MLKNLSIRARLVTMVAALSILMAMIALGAIHALGSSNESLRTVYQDRLVPVGQLDAVIRAINRVQLIATTAVVNGPASYGGSRDAIVQALDEQDKAWQAYMATDLTPEEGKLAEQARQAMDAFRSQIAMPMLTALAVGDATVVHDLVRGRMAVLYRSLRQPVNDLISLQLQVAKAAFDAGVVRYRVFVGVVAATLASALALGAGIAAWLIRSVTRSINHAVAIAESVAAGDLTHPVRIDANDETARLLGALRDMQGSLTGIVTGVRAGTESIHAAAREIATGNNDLARRTEDQAASVEETAASMEELTSTVRQNADNAREASRLAGAAREHAAQGGKVVEDMVRTMGAIRERSGRIVDIIAVIDGIAFQTNILALNAAVEAARAGEQGRGFAVVASEVRNLAQRSATAAKEIKQLIDGAVDEVGRGASLMDETGGTMARIVSSVRQVEAIVNDISAASREQSAGIDQIGEAVVHIDHGTQQNAALVEEAAAAALSMQEQAARLAQAVSVFRVAGRTAPARDHDVAAMRPASARLALTPS
jgi:methyl-accepting chemotaxis protein-1 (serine sensor receptor)